MNIFFVNLRKSVSLQPIVSNCKIMRKKTAIKKPKTGVPVNTQFPVDQFQKLSSYRQKMDMPKVQDVIRLAVSLFLSRQGQD